MISSCLNFKWAPLSLLLRPGLRTRRLGLACLLWLAAGSMAPAQTAYLVTDLGTNVTPYFINGIGDVVGIVGDNNVDIYGSRQRAYFYTNGVATFQGFGLGTTNSGANGINNLDQSVGWYEDLTGVHAFISSDCSTLLDMGVGVNNYPAAPSQWNGAAGINDAGQIVGARNSSLIRAYLIANGQTNNLPTLGNPTDTSIAVAISQGCGVAYNVFTTNYGLYQHACLYTTNGGQFLIPTPPNMNSYAYGINDSNQVVGYFRGTNSPYVYEAFFYDGTIVTNIGGPITNGYAFAYGVNNYGQVVGAIINTNLVPPLSPFIFDESNGLANLNNMLPPGSGWGLGAPMAINDAGQIVGSGGYNGKPHGYLLTPALIFDPTSFKIRHNSVTLTISGINGKTVVFEASCDLMTWTPVSTNVIVMNKATFTDTGSCGPGQVRTYRAQVLP
jgi:uncharacterized membrane protein